ncbi:NUDIX domain-containing protein [Corynebacterium poyangense]|uniref:NUDIX domain-containing protein n=1 Tax=Corynebacterium poyangense TaxID=2684405 RepID=A0A7H0SLI9_9CORY|nr:NUDIX domain-containing protein [Corynebacterium poyangense]MBZ8177511.1 NUDIX domain-containing protein [Corynebacterium poyangense]QNQ89414.1 NUDIX domain-containing protein [Corynebacterium poyangense]
MAIHVHCLIYEQDEHVLLVRKRNTQKFMFPGGKPEPGESSSDTIIRECAEELQVELDPQRLTFLGEFNAQAANEPDQTVVAQAWSTTEHIHPHIAAEIAELIWWPVSNGPDPHIADLSNRYLVGGALWQSSGGHE